MKFSSLIYKSLLGLYGIMPGKRTICHIIKYSGIPNAKFAKDLHFEGEFTVDIGNGKSFKMIHHQSTIENSFFWQGLDNPWESDTMWLWAELSQSAKVVFDIGANVGIYSLVTKATNPGAQIYAFEPVERTFKVMADNFSINKMLVNSEKLALSNANGTQTFYDVASAAQTSASLSPLKLKDTVEYKITTQTLDSYIAAHKIDTIDLMKIDVEMHEPEVIEGFAQNLNRFKPTMVIELLSNEVADRLNSLFSNSNYRYFLLKGKNHLKEMPKMIVDPKSINYLLCRNDVAEKLKPYIKN